ncbi:2'-5' RNA ligase [Rhizobium leguminosarum]|uniref:2'-5' RNA ligase family protein n=1 Tax=Rhizobium leguminosarum TaxID=384 RepID=UPI001A916365|nr:2'-5' RNA ligase family protein [Rhizobium leguminosarum]MBY5557102.1 2'-5' RNA ligase [Rhizobium leguminosarum]MBY5637635.1 2'-5' RNA ligase [Rhizobium leguminosarum]MBY5693054.1 2'-5' RNA ligase [Rhizobium leguminosarum]MBY5727259.1 2'-5' RNA ligase [Rhizobium leguminosarum]MBY5746679.1 2'-5' RNA ligase [Rhizobium leguminosarum]
MNQMPLDFGDDKNGRGRRNESYASRHRLFFALCPSDAIEQQAAAIADDYRRAFSLSGRPRLTTLHVSIIWVGDYPKLPEDAVFAARQAGATVESAPIAITFDRTMSFRREGKARPLVLCGEGGRKALTRLHVQLGVGMHNAGLRHNIRRDFTPHMTLLYDRKTVPPTSLDTPVSWTASEFLLIHSVLGKTEYRIIDRWPLLG